MKRYKYDTDYTEFESLSLRNEFQTVQNYLQFDSTHANDEVFEAFDTIYHWFCIKQNEVGELLEENKRLRLGISEDPFVALLQNASRHVFKTRSQHNATATYNVLTRNGVSDIDSLMQLSIIDASQYRNAGSNVLAVIAAAKDIYAKQNSEPKDGDELIGGNDEA